MPIKIFSVLYIIFILIYVALIKDIFKNVCLLETFSLQLLYQQ